MQDPAEAPPGTQHRGPWNNGKPIGAKPPLPVKARLGDPDEAPGRRTNTRLGDALDAGRYVDAIAKDVVVLKDDVAKVYTDAKFDPLVLRHVGVSLDHLALSLHRAGDSVYHAGKLHQYTVAGQLHDPALVLSDPSIDQLSAMRPQRCQRAHLAHAHKPAVADYICG